MEIFKESKKQPIKFRGFKFIGHHSDYPEACYYYKALPRDNFELMECMLEGQRKPEIGAGTNVKIIDAFMARYLYNKQTNTKFKTSKLFIKNVVNKTYGDFSEKQKEGFIKQFTSDIPKEVLKSELFKKFADNGYEVLYCSDDETEERKMAIVNIVLVKEEHLVRKELQLDRKITLFKPLKFRVLPSYLKGESKKKYMEEELPEVVIYNEILK